MRPPSPDAESHGQITPSVRPRAAACSTPAASTHRLPESWGERTRKRRTIIPTPTTAPEQPPTGQQNVAARPVDGPQRVVLPKDVVLATVWRSHCRHTAFSSARYRYSVARLTPRYLAISLPVWPSAFIRLAVAMCSGLSTFRGRPNLVPLARDDARFRAVRSSAPQAWRRPPFAIWSCKNRIVAFSNASCTKSPIASAVGGAVSLYA
jgi:hypothetical protein